MLWVSSIWVCSPEDSGHLPCAYLHVRQDDERAEGSLHGEFDQLHSWTLGHIEVVATHGAGAGANGMAEVGLAVTMPGSPSEYRTKLHGGG